VLGRLLQCIEAVYYSSVDLYNLSRMLDIQFCSSPWASMPVMARVLSRDLWPFMTSMSDFGIFNTLRNQQRNIRRLWKYLALHH
jgi:hypothetical protein